MLARAVRVVAPAASEWAPQVDFTVDWVGEAAVFASAGAAELADGRGRTFASPSAEVLLNRSKFGSAVLIDSGQGGSAVAVLAEHMVNNCCIMIFAFAPVTDDLHGLAAERAVGGVGQAVGVGVGAVLGEHAQLVVVLPGQLTVTVQLRVQSILCALANVRRPLQIQAAVADIAVQGRGSSCGGRDLGDEGVARRRCSGHAFRDASRPATIFELCTKVAENCIRVWDWHGCALWKLRVAPLSGPLDLAAASASELLEGGQEQPVVQHVHIESAGNGFNCHTPVRGETPSRAVGVRGDVGEEGHASFL